MIVSYRYNFDVHQSNKFSTILALAYVTKRKKLRK